MVALQKIRKERTISRIAVLLLGSVIYLQSCSSLPSADGSSRRRGSIDAEDLILKQTDAPPADRHLHAEHYPASNERRLDLFKSRVEGLGGGYVGVGTDQNLTLIAWAKSDYAYLSDFDPVTVSINRIHLYFLELAPNYAEFAKLWDPKNKKETLLVLEKKFSTDPEYQVILKSYEIALRKGGVAQRLGDLPKISKVYPAFTSFHNDTKDYEFLRNMVLEGRILAVDGNLLGDKTLHSVSEKAKELGIPVRILYTSNAEEYFRYPDGMKSNFLNLYGDSRSIVVRTLTKGAKIYGFPDGEMFPKEFPFHYNVQSLDNFKVWLTKLNPVYTTLILKARTPGVKGFSTIEALPTETSKPNEATAAANQKPANKQ
ncbi:hypothetical protein EHO59_05145 [Leptospira semungkisensis]|uniref:DUF7790 domain-containing protein n=1 Tax=Leptospira semungkisensis TaxID=2484985 RepID=A0A4R9G8W3_9LEPT|nr:hypothetical protein [Leptospira semungkisensis]TGK07490.1 hypothetical protein EHO59_05145 [Leptospira semungkisensis]